MRTALIVIILILTTSLLFLVPSLANPSQPTYAHPDLQLTSTLSSASTVPAGPANLNIEIQSMEIDSIVYGDLVSGTWDVWTFEGEAGTILTITLNSTNFDAYLELYTNEQVLITDDDDSGRKNNAQIIEIELPSTGVFRIFVRSFNDTGSGRYQLIVDSFTNQGYDPELATEIEYGDSQTGLLTDTEYIYSFEGEAGDIITATVSSATFDTYIILTDSAGEILLENDDTERSTNSAIINYELEFDDTYYLFVVPLDFGGGGPFSLALYETSTSVEATGGTIDINTTITGILSPNSYADWFFEGEEGQVVSITTVTDPPAERFNLMFELYGPDEELIRDDRDGGLALNAALTDIVLPDDGEYRIRVMEEQSTIGGEYRIGLAEGRVYFDPYANPAQVVIYDDEPITTPSIIMEENGQLFNAWVIANLPSDELTITLTTSAGEAARDDFILRVFDTDWVFIADSRDGQIILEDLPATFSDYIVLIQYDGRGQRDYSLTFSADD